MNLTREGLAERSGVTWSSLRRFERTGFIALESLLKLALVLDCLGDFEKLCLPVVSDLQSKSLDELLTDTKTRQKGRLK